MGEKIFGYDPVVHVPFRSTFGEDFGHVGAPLKLIQGGYVEYADTESRGLFPDFVAEAIASFKKAMIDGLTSSFPHFLARYAERVDGAIGSGRYADLRQCGGRKNGSKSSVP